MGELTGLIAVLGAFAIPGFIIWSIHRRKMLELQLRMRSTGDETVRSTVESLQAEVRALRDTTTQYDVSFDTALQRMERRLDALENNAVTARSQSGQSGPQLVDLQSRS